MSYHRIIRMLATRYDSGFGTVDYTCDGCGERVVSRELPPGWAEDGDRHRCPGCEAAAAEDAGSSLDPFTRQYVETALWSSNDDAGDPLDSNYGIEDMDPATLRTMAADCARFQSDNSGDIPPDGDERAGHDFWLTRNGHGAGFWDGDWPEPAATRLTDASKAFGEFDLYVGDDGRVHG